MYAYTLPDLDRECRLAAKYQRPCPDCGSKWNVRRADSGLRYSDGRMAPCLFVALVCRKCKAHDATTVAI